jgi:hypothetical protein
MTFSVFFALLQVLLKSESKVKDQKKAGSELMFHKETIRKETEAIPVFVKRYQSQSFDLWENSFPANKTKTKKNESTKTNQK